LGGPDLDILFITCSSNGVKEDDTVAGGIFMARVETRGLEENQFKDE
jgi:sugar lactone lactonase YvrE